MPRGKPQAGQPDDTIRRRYDLLPTGENGAPSWHEADPAQLGAAALNVAALGDALLVGATSDGGALHLMIFHGKDRQSHYFPHATGVDQLTDALQKLQE